MIVIVVVRSILAGVKSLTLPLACLAVAIAATAGCARRQVTVTSNPSGALVYLNDREVGRTPFTTDLVWYGTYDVVLRKEGYETLHKRTRVNAPWWGLSADRSVRGIGAVAPDRSSRARLRGCAKRRM